MKRVMIIVSGVSHSRSVLNREPQQSILTDDLPIASAEN
jgi:hypothetical protein